MKRYLKALRLIWWDKDIECLLFFAVFLTGGFFIPVIIVVNIIQTLRFTYLHLVCKDTHSWYWEMIDSSGIYKCHIHDRVFGSYSRSCDITTKEG